MIEQVQAIVEEWLKRRWTSFSPDQLKFLNLSVHNLYAFADDLALLLSGPKVRGIFRRATGFILQTLQKVSEEWGLFINWDKCGIIPVGSSKLVQQNVFEGIYGTAAVEDQKTKTLSHVLIKLSGVDGKYSCKLPFCYTYKYLGIQISGNLKFNSHYKFLRKKIGFISHAFTPLRRKDDVIKFDHNMWQTMVSHFLTIVQPTHITPQLMVKFTHGSVH